MFKKLLGYGFYFIGIGLWFILLSVALFWSIPWIALSFIAGWLTHAREWPELKHYLIWKWLRKEYFVFEVEGDLPTNPAHGRIIYAIYPHGHYSVTATFYWALNPMFSNAKAAVHSFIFYLPIFGSFVRWIGAIGVTEQEMKQALLENLPIYMCPGGVAEIDKTGKDIVRRSGFIRIACETNSTLFPVWCPDERSYYTHYTPFGRLLEPVLGFPIPLFIWGKWWCPFLPNRPVGGKPSRICIGRGINCEGKTLGEAEREFWEEMDKLQKK